MSKKSTQRSKTLSIAGIEEIRALITIFNPSFLLIILKGLSARIALRDFKLLSVSVFGPPEENVNPKSTIELITTKKSNIFQALRI